MVTPARVEKKIVDEKNYTDYDVLGISQLDWSIDWNLHQNLRLPHALSGLTSDFTAQGGG